MDRTLKSRFLLTLGLLCAGLSGFLFFTDPNELPIGLLVIPILLVFFVVYLLGLLACDLFKLFPKHPRRRRTFSILIATMFAVVMVLQSTGGLIINDVILISIIIALSLFYVSKF